MEHLGDPMGCAWSSHFSHLLLLTGVVEMKVEVGLEKGEYI